jgi:hypothetical protein
MFQGSWVLRGFLRFKKNRRFLDAWFQGFEISRFSGIKFLWWNQGLRFSRYKGFEASRCQGFEISRNPKFDVSRNKEIKIFQSF